MKDTSLLIGQINEENLTSYSWYDIAFNRYTPDQTATASLRNYVSDLKVMVVMGTWCSDSHELVPAFLKLSKAIGLKKSQIEMIAVDRKKNCPLPDITSLNIEYVPTFFVFYKGKLVGKIVEEATTSIEDDMLKLIETNK